MSKKPINLIGSGFRHTVSTNGFDPKFITWVKDDESSDISIHVDHALMTPINPDKINYGWLCESKTIQPQMYSWCKNNIVYLKEKFKKVFTHDVELSKISDIFQLTLCSSKSFINCGDVYKKTKLVSMVASNKIMCQEHRYRQQMIQKFSNKCDHFGRGFRYLKDKKDGLKDYCFSITMENATYSNMFTEKITDCFMCGTIPIYYGISNIGDFFNPDGIIILNGDFKIEDLSFELYQSKIEAVKENYKIANEMFLAEDYIYKNFIKNE